MARWLKLFLLVLGIAGVAFATLPWWLGAVARPILGHWDVTFDRYERRGYAHFRLLGLRYANAHVEITAKQVESATPVVWLTQRLRGSEPIIAAEGWRVSRVANGGLETSRRKAAPTSEASGRKTINGMPDLHALLRRIVPQLSHWLPQVHLSSGEVRGFGFDAVVTTARWQKSVLTVEDARIWNRKIAFELTPAVDGSFVLTSQTAENDARLRLVWTGAEITAEGALWDQPLQFSAHFPAEGWLPTEANALADNWRLPAARVKLAAPYAEVRGDIRFAWHDGTFDLALNAKATPAPDNKSKAPPFEATAKAQGNLRELTVTALHIDAPFAIANLTAPVKFSIDRPLSGASAQLTVQADLAKLPWFEARGKVEGTVSVTGDNAATRQTFELKFNDVGVRDFSLKEGHARGVLAWPRLELTELKLQLDESSSLQTHGSVNWQTRELSGVALEAKVGREWFARWLPSGASWATAEISATAEGPLAAPHHRGTLKLTDAHLPPLHPFAIDSEWEGIGAKLEISARAASEKTKVELVGTLEPHGLQLGKLRVAAADQLTWELVAPARVVWSPTWQIDGLQLSGGDSRLSLNRTPDGLFSLTATNFSSAHVQDWIALTGPEWQVHSLQATGHIAEGVLVFETKLDAQLAMSPQPAQVKLVASGDAHGIEIKEANVVTGARILTRATGRLPVTWRIETTPHLSLDETAPLELSASTEPDSPLWAALAATTGLQLDQPTAKIDLKGSLRQPVGEMQANAAKVSVASDRFSYPVPEFNDLALALNFGREKITVSQFSAKLDGQAVTASAQLPMGDDGWETLWRSPKAFDWSKAVANLEIADADLAAFGKRWPVFPATQGQLTARVKLAPGGKFSGELRVTDAASRPLPAIGALRDIQAELVLAGQEISVRKMTATLGSEPVALDGSITLVAGGAPRLALGLKGKNLPLVRTTGLLLRSDVDLRADTDAAGLTRLSGALNVRDCLVLANVDLKTLLPTGLRGVSRQPPYFAVEAEPFRRWPLAVEVRASSAVRVRTTAYNGTASAHFKLGGTLGEPRAVGELTVDRGQVLFPFATFTVQQGAVRLREADPFHAVVSVNATSVRRDYQMRLEMKGELPTPNVTITSTPAMEAADVLLMVMTGQPPVGETTATGSSGPRLALLGAYLGRGLFQDLGFGGEDRLEISSGEHVSRQGRETYEFEYKLGEHWSLLGEYDQFDSYNAGLKWRVYTEESKPLEKK